MKDRFGTVVGWGCAALAALGILASVAPAFADTTIQGDVRQIPVGDAPALGATVGCRIYQVTGPVTTINANTPFCYNQRCLRTFNTGVRYGGDGFGGYPCNSESSGVYGPPQTEPSDQVFYNLIDANANAGTCDHIGFYAVQGQLVNNNAVNNPGDPRALNCAGTVTINCFTAADPSNADPTPLISTHSTFGSLPHQIRSTGGLSPIPVPHPSVPGQGAGCGLGQVRVWWEDPISADPTMKNGVSSPILGVNLYRNDAGCGDCPSELTAGWVRTSSLLAPNGEYGPDSGTAGDCLDMPAEGHSWFALTMRVKGSGSGPTTLESYLGSNSICTATVGTASRIVSLGARYAGRAVVRVDWTSGVEGGVQGYYVTRASSPAGPYTRVSGLLSAAGDGSRYSFSDRIRTSLGRSVLYQLEIVASDGAIERSGTTSVIVPGPKVKRLGGE